MSKSEVNFRIFGAVYVPLQFLIVWIVYFGFTTEPELLRIVQAFNITGIVQAALNFYQLIPVVFTAESATLFLLKALPYIVLLAAECIPILIFLFVLLQLVQYILAIISYIIYNGSLSLQIAFTIKCGAPGTGKSASGGYDAQYLAKMLWQDLKFRHWQMQPQVKKWEKYNNAEKLKEWKEIRDAYTFWATKDCIPCLASNIPLEQNGQFALRVTRDHIYQQTRMPAFTVVYIDEISSMVDVTNSGRDRPLEVTDLFRWARHFGFIAISTEQDAERVQIDMRRVSGKNVLMLWQKAICKPVLICLLYGLLKLIPKLTNYEKPNKALSAILRFLKKLIDYTGFRKLTYKLTDTHTGGGKTSRKKSFCLPSMLPYKYDDRTFREFYEPLEEPITYDIFSSLKLQESQKESFMRKTKHELARENEEYMRLAHEVYSDVEAAKKVREYLNRLKEEDTLISKLENEDVRNQIETILIQRNNEREQEKPSGQISSERYSRDGSIKYLSNRNGNGKTKPNT